jgi:hypothetical protein
MTDALDKSCATAKAAELWPNFTDSEKHGIRFGLFPRHKMEQAEAELVLAEVPPREAGRLLAVALMKIAEKNGGMIA